MRLPWVGSETSQNALISLCPLVVVQNNDLFGRGDVCVGEIHEGGRTFVVVKLGNTSVVDVLGSGGFVGGTFNLQRKTKQKQNKKQQTCNN